MNDFLINCTFNGLDCSSSDFSPSTSKFGRCYSFGSKNIRHFQTLSGSKFGLNLVLQVSPKGMENVTTNSLLGRSGEISTLTIIVHPSYEPPEGNIGGFMMPGYSVFVPIRLTMTETIDRPPWTLCKQNTASDLPPPYDEIYSIKSCQKVCESKVLAQLCGCTPWFVGNLTEAKACSLTRSLYCQLIGNKAEFRESCVEQCLPACQSVDYSISPTYAKLRQSDDLDSSQSIHIAFYFEEFTYLTRISSEAYAIGSFLGLHFCSLFPIDSVSQTFS